MPENHDKIVFYHNPQSRGAIAHWMLEEAGAPYEVRLLRFDKGEHKSPEYLALNPMGKIPTLVYRGVVITEVAAICAWLADAFPGRGLAPALDDPQRATYLRWLFFAAGCIEPAVTDKAFPRQGEPRKGTLGYGSYEDVMNAMEQALKPGPWILGDRFSAADVYMGAQISFGLRFKTVEDRPVFVDYVRRIEERPAKQRANAQNMAWLEQLSQPG